MAAAAKSLRAALRSSPSLRKAATKLAADAKPARSSFSRMSKQNPNRPRFIRSPVEMSCCVESLLPLHSATASAVLTSMLAVSRSSFWLSEGKELNELLDWLALAGFTQG